jgi:hypothetical protein
VGLGEAVVLGSGWFDRKVNDCVEVVALQVLSNRSVFLLVVYAYWSMTAVRPAII